MKLTLFNHNIITTTEPKKLVDLVASDLYYHCTSDQIYHARAITVSKDANDDICIFARAGSHSLNSFIMSRHMQDDYICNTDTWSITTDIVEVMRFMKQHGLTEIIEISPK